jgi:ATP-dependent exoDNAse (exonuclease V) beta subunit
MMGTIYEPDYLEEHQQNTVDNLNLLYVAFTRASRGLYVTGKRGAKASRSALLELVLPAIVDQLQGATLDGMEDDGQPLCFSYGDTRVCPADKAQQQRPSDNIFTQQPATVEVPLEVFSGKAEFKQSNKSRELAMSDDDDEQQQTSYIQLGSVLHNVFQHVRTAADIDSALREMELEGIIYNEEITRERIELMLRKRLQDPRVADWFSGRWTLFNECTILFVDTATGKVVERRPDRVMGDGSQMVVVDFKFGREREEYHAQVREYMELLRRMGHQQVTGYLWFVYTNKIVEVR